MENNENKLPVEKERQIQLVVNSSQDEGTIDLGNVFRNMKLKKRKIKYSAIFFLCWFALLVFLVDGFLKFQTLVDYFGS